jgi:hypothetical protein
MSSYKSSVRSRDKLGVMSSPAYYRAEALRCRELAARARDEDVMKRWLKMALEYEQLAESIETFRMPLGTPQAQPMQQQQQKKSDPDKS